MKALHAAGVALVLLGLSAAHLQAGPINVNVTDDPTVLANTILGSGVTLVGTPTFTGASTSAGTFTGAFADGLGFNSGIILTSGNAADAVGPNSNGVVESIGGGGVGDDTTTAHGTAGDADLNALSGGTSFDAAVLELEFESAGGDLFFNYVFASEEYLDFVGTPFNDVFGFFLDGVNIALIPGSLDPVAINNVNPNTNSAFYRNNIDNPHGLPGAGNLNLEYDGYTTVLTAMALGLAPGTHTLKLAVADVSDEILDSAVFIQAGTLSDQPTPVIPEPSSLALLGIGTVGLLGVSRRRRAKAAAQA